MTRKTTERRRVAIVEDEGDFRALVRRWLAPDYDTLSFLDAEDLLESEQEATPLDLIITDVKMPGLDGFSFCRTLRSDSRWSRVPVLFLTGLDSDESFLQGVEAGGDAYLAKPVERLQLLHKIAELLDRKPALR